MIVIGGHKQKIRLISLVASLLLFCHQSQSNAKINDLDSSLDWGSDQVSLLLHDRPQLQSIVVKWNQVWNWLVNAFENTNEGIKIHWDASPVSSSGPYNAESLWIEENKNVYIRVRRFYENGSERTSEEVLFSVVFELNNVKYRDENLKARTLAREGKISRDEYSRTIAKYEYLASQETGIFYRNVWTPYCVKANFNLNPHIWIIARDISFKQWLDQYPPDSFYPWQFYGKQYDIIHQQRDYSTHKTASPAL